MSRHRMPSLLSDDFVVIVDETAEKPQKLDVKAQILLLLGQHTYGLTIEDVARLLKINRATASKYLFALAAEGLVVVRDVGKAKLHYLKKYFGGSHD